MAFNGLGEILDLLKKRFPELDKRLEESEAIKKWDFIVGPVIAKHSRAARINQGVLIVEVDHPVWRSELHFRKKEIIHQLNTRLESELKSPILDIFIKEVGKFTF
jgi:predicted nucleic acid-binding Zn ribbon protein